MNFAVKRAAVIFLTLAGFSLSTAAMTDSARLAQWYTPSKIGLMLHWGMGTYPKFTTVSAFENAVATGGWNAGKWVAAANKVHAGFITIATFHTSHKHLRIWHSDIPGRRPRHEII